MGTIQTLQDTGSNNQITPSMDGAVYGLGTPDCVCGGLGDEFELHASSSSLTVSFYAGSQCVIGGNFFKVKENTDVVLTPEVTDRYLCARINSGQASGSTGSFELLTSANIQHGNLNGGTAIRDFILYKLSTNANGVILESVEDKRVILESADSLDEEVEKILEKNMIIGTLSANQTTLTISHSDITENSIISVYTEVYGVNPETVVVSNGSVTLTFEAQEQAMKVGIKMEGSYS